MKGPPPKPPCVQVTRYQRGQYQRLHFDARPAGDPDGLKQFLEVCLLQGLSSSWLLA